MKKLQKITLLLIGCIALISCGANKKGCGLSSDATKIKPSSNTHSVVIATAK